MMVRAVGKRLSLKAVVQLGVLALTCALVFTTWSQGGIVIRPVLQFAPSKSLSFCLLLPLSGCPSCLYPRYACLWVYVRTRTDDELK